MERVSGFHGYRKHAKSSTGNVFKKMRTWDFIYMDFY